MEGFKRTLIEHTYDERVKQLLKIIEINFKKKIKILWQIFFCLIFRVKVRIKEINVIKCTKITFGIQYLEWFSYSKLL